MRALIVGGGVAGPAVALALDRAGIDSAILERQPLVETDASADVGSYLTLAPNGVDALATLGALEPVRHRGFSSRVNTMYGATGRVLGRIPLGAPLTDGTVGLTLKRSQLAAALLEQARCRGVDLHRGSRVVSVRSVRDGVEAELQDGSVITGDLLVGADGVHSLVRRTIDPAAPKARYVGLTNFGGITHNTPIAGRLEPEAWSFVFGRRSFFGAHPTPQGGVVWFVNVPRAEITPGERQETTPQQWQSWLADLVADDAGHAAELVSTGHLELSGDNTYDLPHVPTWSRDNMLVLGDAAHAPSPSSGQGASMALEDAVVLARSLRDAPDVPTALAAYEHVRRARVEKIVKAGARSSSSKIPGRLGLRLQDHVLSLVFRHLVTQKSTAWMTGHRIDWNSRAS